MKLTEVNPVADAVMVTLPVLFGVVYETLATPDEFVISARFAESHHLLHCQ